MSEPHAADCVSDGRTVVHVVCHDCGFETVVGPRSPGGSEYLEHAKYLVDSHARIKDHNIESLEVAGR